MLAIVFECERFNMYTHGAEVEVHSDHKPLESIFKKPLYKVPPRLQRMRLRLQKYDIKVKYVPGKFQYCLLFVIFAIHKIENLKE